jgi:PAS domain S-box-containing protein
MGIISAADGVYADANEAIAALLGYPRREILGRAFTSIGTNVALDGQMILDVLRQNEQLGDIPITITSRDGSIHVCVISIQLETVDDQPYFIIIIQDFTEQEQAQLVLESYENRFRLFFNSVPLPLLVIDEETFRIVDVNPAACGLYGYGRDEFLALSLNDLVPPGGRGAVSPAVGRRGASGGAGISRQRLKNGAVIEAKVTSYSFVLDGRRASLSIIQDVTEQRAVQAALETSEERLRIIADLMADAIWDYDLVSGAVSWNAGLESLFGYMGNSTTPYEWWFERIHPEDRAAISASIESAFASADIYWMAEYRFQRADGSYANVLDNGYVVRDADGRPTRFIGSMVDITERLMVAEVATRAALEERQRLAHNLHDSVTQSLYSISLLAEASRRRAESGEQEVVTDYVGRLGELTMQTLRQMRLLLYDLRPGVLAQEGLAGALRHRLEAVEHRAGIKARLIDETRGPIPPALKDELFWIAQEVLNNSLRHASATTVTVLLGSEGGDVILEVSDNGSGFEHTAAEHSGGLAAIRRRVNELNGQLEVNTRSDKGTRVRVRLPRGKIQQWV